MAKKRERPIVDDEQIEKVEIPTPIEESTPSIIALKKERPLRVGYVYAKLRGKENIVQIPLSQVGKAYKESDWEILSDKKK